MIENKIKLVLTCINVYQFCIIILLLFDFIAFNIVI